MLSSDYKDCGTDKKGTDALNDPLITGDFAANIEKNYPLNLPGIALNTVPGNLCVSSIGCDDTKSIKKDNLCYPKCSTTDWFPTYSGGKTICYKKYSTHENILDASDNKFTRVTKDNKLRDKNFCGSKEYDSSWNVCRVPCPAGFSRYGTDTCYRNMPSVPYLEYLS